MDASHQSVPHLEPYGGSSKTVPYTPANVLATMYRHLGMDPAMTVLDNSQRPIPLLDDPRMVRELM